MVKNRMILLEEMFELHERLVDQAFRFRADGKNDDAVDMINDSQLVEFGALAVYELINIESDNVDLKRISRELMAKFEPIVNRRFELLTIITDEELEKPL